MPKRTLQQQGVPFPERLRGPEPTYRRERRTPISTGGSQTEVISRSRGRQRRSVSRRTPIESDTGGTQVETYTEDVGSQGRGNNRAGIRNYSPTNMGDRAGSSVGLLEAEFFGILFLLVLQLFIGGSGTYGDKIMSFMKRGTLTAILFFFLALIAGIGPNAAKVTKGLGALVFVAILLTTPGQDVIVALDNFFKANWTGTQESDIEPASSNKGTQGTSNNAAAKVAGAAESTWNTITKIAETIGLGFIK